MREKWNVFLDFEVRDFGIYDIDISDNVLTQERGSDSKVPQ